MVVIALFFILVFFIPIYRTARAKGYPYRPILQATIFYTGAVYLFVAVAGFHGVNEWVLRLAWLPVSLVLIVLQVLPFRPGAPGWAWFKIKTRCPECGASIELQRDRVGLVDACPQCDEILTVPSESTAESPGASAGEASGMGWEATGAGMRATGSEALAASVREDSTAAPESSAANAAALDSTDDAWVLVRGYDSTHLAELDQTLLEEAGLPTLLQPAGPGSAIFGATTLGCQLWVPESERERAEEILASPEVGAEADDPDQAGF